VTVHLRKSLLGVTAHLEADETETFALSGVSVLDDIGTNHLSEWRKEVS
jgi:hypothetical protein